MHNKLNLDSGQRNTINNIFIVTAPCVRNMDYEEKMIREGCWHSKCVAVLRFSNQSIKSNLFATKKNIMQHKKNKANMSTGHKGSMKLH